MIANTTEIKFGETDVTHVYLGTELLFGETGGTVTSDTEYNPSEQHQPNTDIIYNQTPGKPNVKTDSEGKVTEYTFTDTGGTGVTTSNVDTGIIAFDSTNPGFTIHLVAEFAPSASTADKPIIYCSDEKTQYGLTVYTYSNYCYKKLKTQAYDSAGSFYKAWSVYSPTGKDTNYYKNRNTITFNAVFTEDKKFTLLINGKATDFNNYSFEPSNDSLTVKVGVGISDFTIKEFSVKK